MYSELKLWIWRLETHPSRPGKYLFYPEMRLDVPITEIDTEEKLKSLCQQFLYPGVFVIRALTRSKKNRTGWKWVRIFLTRISDNNQVFIRQNKLKRRAWWNNEAFEANNN